MKLILNCLAAFALSLILSSCGKSEKAVRSDKLSVVATIGMISDVTKVIAGDLAEVQGIVGEGVDPHLYQPTANDLKMMSEADIVLYNGLHLEGKMGESLAKLAAKGKSVIAVAEKLQERPNFLLKAEEDEFDPHVWMDVSAWALAVDEIIKTLSDVDAGNAATYAANGEALKVRMAALHRYAADSIASIPDGQRVLVTAHDAFGYMAKAYGLEVHGVQGLSTESEAGLQDIEALVTMLVERNIPSVFIETSVSDKNVRALIEGAKAQGHTVTVGGELFSDAMGPAGSYEGTYLGMIDHNITRITNALGGKAEGFQKN